MKRKKKSKKVNRTLRNLKLQTRNQFKLKMNCMKRKKRKQLIDGSETEGYADSKNDQ